MNRKQLEQRRKFVEVQTRWALLYGGDQELLELLRIQRDRLAVMAAQSAHHPHLQRTASSRFACWPLMSNARMAASTAASASGVHAEVTSRGGKPLTVELVERSSVCSWASLTSFHWYNWTLLSASGLS